MNGCKWVALVVCSCIGMVSEILPPRDSLWPNENAFGFVLRRGTRHKMTHLACYEKERLKSGRSSKHRHKSPGTFGSSSSCHSSSNSEQTKIHHRSSHCHLSLSDLPPSSLNYDTKQSPLLFLEQKQNTMRTTDGPRPMRI